MRYTGPIRRWLTLVAALSAACGGKSVTSEATGGGGGSGGVLRLRELSLTPSVSIELPIPGYDGTRIALAAAGERVAVAWLNESSGAEASAPGGFALLACSE